MGLRAYRISEYDHIAEQKQFDIVRALLKERYDNSADDAVFIGNYNIEGVELDALLITNYRISILEFKNWGGNIVARENGNWMSDDKAVGGGASNKNPFVQLRTNRSRTTAGLKRYLGRNDLTKILGVIIFGQDAVIYDDEISEITKKWLRICDNRTLESTLFDEESTPFFSREEMLEIPRKMNLGEFVLYDNPSDGTKELLPPPAYVEQTALSFYTELYEAMTLHIRATYNEFKSILRQAAEQKTAFKALKLNGIFAKINFLVAEYKIDDRLNKAINTTRSRIRNANDRSEAELQKYATTDLKAICEFIEAIYSEPIPDHIRKAFPQAVTEEIPVKSAIVAQCYRVIVSEWDDTFIYGKSEEIQQDSVKIRYGKCNEMTQDWSYIKEYLFAELQINIIKPRLIEGIYYPEAIIIDPDYLVDVSTIANCFEDYTHRPLLNLVKKIQPFETSEAIMLGNLAGQLLDEEVHSSPEDNAYVKSYNKYIRDNAFTALTTDAPDLKRKGEEQKRNIRRALNEGLKAEVCSYRSDKVILEPSFFCEMLGLQGRMDFLQMDYQVLLEQKSGKGAFVPGAKEDDPPRQQDKHYVQMLLYQAILHYNFGKDNKDIRSFLLYSKFHNGLIGLGPAPELLHEAFKIRNGLAWCENMYCRNGAQVLDGLTAETFRNSNVKDKFWNAYIAPKLNEVFNPINTASPLEKAYFFRFMSFLENEHMLAKVGDKSSDDNGFASKWHNSLEDKKESGNIYDNLNIAIPKQENGPAIKVVEMLFPKDMSADTSNFRKGDIVIAYPYTPDEEPDARRTMVFRCTILDITTEKLILQLRSIQSDRRIFYKEGGKVWAVEHDFLESSFSSLYRGMFMLLTASKERRDLLLFRREPNTDKTRRLIGEYGDFNELALKVKQAKDLFLIIGPPGTGKTSYGMLNTVKEELASLEVSRSEDSILIMSYTNRAVDEICSKLVEDGIDFLRLGHKHSCGEEYRDYLLDSKLEGMSDIGEMRQKIDGTKVIVGTTTALNGHIALFKIKSFSLAIIDEASQILEPHLIGILCAKHGDGSAIKKVVMIGDHKQLPAVVQQNQKTSRVTDPDLNRILLTDCRLSLFERLLKKYKKDPSVTYMLTKQGRMHRDIAIFPNYCFYQGKLEVVPLPHQEEELPVHADKENGIDTILSTRRVAFLAAKAPKDNLSDKVNVTEAKMLAATVVRIYLKERENFDPSRTVGVIVPYRNQIATIRNLIDKYGYPVLRDITIDTVERYQGSQRDYILYGFTVHKLYQLNFLTSNVFEEEGSIIDRKLNVAMTRAREHLIMFGNPQLLSEDITFYKLIAFARSKHGYFDVEPDAYVKGEFTVPDYEKKDLNLCDATYGMSEAFGRAFDSLVMNPVKAASPDYPAEIFGADMNTNLNLIQYGRVNFSNQLNLFEEGILTPEKQVLLYCYYIMRQHYCSGKNLYESYRDYLVARITATGGRVKMIDIGCGPATCGLAFGEVFAKVAPDMLYVGIDVSQGMKAMADSMLGAVFGHSLRWRFISYFNELGDTFWKAVSEEPSTIILNFSYFFSNVPPKFTEDLARSITTEVQAHPFNKYLVICQHSDLDAKLNSYKVFMTVLSERFSVYKSEASGFCYMLNHKEKTLRFNYDILENF